MSLMAIVTDASAEAAYAFGDALTRLCRRARFQNRTWTTVIHRGSVVSIHPDAPACYRRELYTRRPAGERT